MSEPIAEDSVPAALPDDPDLEVAQTATGAPRAIHLRPSFLAVVFVGGTVGTACREAVSLAFPPINRVPYAIFAVNVVGAFALGLLLTLLAYRGPDHGRRRVTRLLFGTGVLGGFTTYSALATDAASLIGSGSAGAGIAYGLATVIVGAAATIGGIASASALRTRGARA